MHLNDFVVMDVHHEMIATLWISWKGWASVSYLQQSKRFVCWRIRTDWNDSGTVYCHFAELLPRQLHYSRVEYRNRLIFHKMTFVYRENIFESFGKRSGSKSDVGICLTACIHLWINICRFIQWIHVIATGIEYSIVFPNIVTDFVKILMKPSGMERQLK